MIMRVKGEDKHLDLIEAVGDLAIAWLGAGYTKDEVVRQVLRSVEWSLMCSSGKFMSTKEYNEYAFTKQAKSKEYDEHSLSR